MKIDVCFSPALYPFYHQNEALVVVVDVFRATTTMITAFLNGAKKIRPVATVKEAETYKKQGWLVGAERNVKRCDFADFGNSPFDYSADLIKDKEIIMTTTNGTKSITIAKDSYRVIVGAFTNISAVARYCLETKRDVIVLCSGWNDLINIEDTFFGGALVELLLESGTYTAASDAARIAYNIWIDHKDDPIRYLESSDHMQRLKAHGLDDVVTYCLTRDLSDKVPELIINNNVLILK